MPALSLKSKSPPAPSRARKRPGLAVSPAGLGLSAESRVPLPAGLPVAYQLPALAALPQRSSATAGGGAARCHRLCCISTPPRSAPGCRPAALLLPAPEPPCGVPSATVLPAPAPRSSPGCPPGSQRSPAMVRWPLRGRREAGWTASAFRFPAPLPLLPPGTRPAIFSSSRPTQRA